MKRPFLSVIAISLAIGVTAPAWLSADRLVVLCIPLATAVSVVLLDRWDKAAVRRAKAAAIAARPDPEWAISLLVDADEKSGILRPVVQLLGPQLPGDITVDLRVCDTSGEVSLTTERCFSEPATRTDLVLGTLAVPSGISVEKVALCDWSVVVSHNGSQIARRCGPLTGASHDNDEAELRAPDLELAPDEVEPPAPPPEPVRSLRWTIALSCAAGGIAIGGYSLTTLSAWLWFAGAPLIVVAGILAVAAALLFHTVCPLCGGSTTIVGRTGAQHCDSCHQAFTLAPV
jgi:hypothetical protein